jgi:hypothetical protein
MKRREKKREKTRKEGKNKRSKTWNNQALL